MTHWEKEGETLMQNMSKLPHTGDTTRGGEPDDDTSGADPAVPPGTAPPGIILSCSGAVSPAVKSGTAATRPPCRSTTGGPASVPSSPSLALADPLPVSKSTLHWLSSRSRTSIALASPARSSDDVGGSSNVGSHMLAHVRTRHCLGEDDGRRCDGRRTTRRRHRSSRTGGGVGA